MAKKSEKDKSIELFHSVINRMNINVLYEYNRMWLIQLEEYRCIIIPDNTLYDELMTDDTFKEKIKPCNVEIILIYQWNKLDSIGCIGRTF